MSDSSRDRKCPSCGGGDIEPQGVTTAFYPRQVSQESDRGRGKKVVEQRFRCRECAHEFTEVDESDV